MQDLVPGLADAGCAVVADRNVRVRSGAHRCLAGARRSAPFPLHGERIGVIELSGNCSESARIATKSGPKESASDAPTSSRDQSTCRASTIKLSCAGGFSRDEAGRSSDNFSYSGEVVVVSIVSPRGFEPLTFGSGGRRRDRANLKRLRGCGEAKRARCSQWCYMRRRENVRQFQSCAEHGSRHRQHWEK